MNQLGFAGPSYGRPRYPSRADRSKIIAFRDQKPMIEEFTLEAGGFIGDE